MKKFFALALTLCHMTIYCQWLQTGYTGSYYVRCFANIGNTVFAGSEYDGVSKSVDNGNTWVSLNNALAGLMVSSMVVSGNTLFVGTYDAGVLYSSDLGNNWTTLNNGITNTQISSLGVSGNDLYAGSNGGGIFKSTNNGVSWTTCNTGLTSLKIMSIKANGNNLYAGSYTGKLFLSTNNGNNWSQINSGITTSAIYSIAFSGARVYFGGTTYPSGTGGIYYSDNNGITWTAFNNGLTELSISDIVNDNGVLFTSTVGGGVFSATPYSQGWTQLNEGLNVGLYNLILTSLAKINETLFTGTESDHIFKRECPSFKTILTYQNACSGNTVVPIKVIDMNGVASISLSLGYDNSAVSYVGYQNPDPALNNGMILVNNVVDKVNISWFSIAPISIANGTLLELQFSGLQANSFLNWDIQTPGACYYTNFNGNNVQSMFLNGMLNLVSDCGVIEGTLTYDNSSSSPITNSTVILKQGGTIVTQTTTNNNGEFSFANLSSGIYSIACDITKPWGGGNAVDALKIMRHFVGLEPLTGLRAIAGDVDGTSFLNSADALSVMKRFVGIINTFQIGNWVVENNSQEVVSPGTVNVNLKVLCAGDVDGSFIPAP